MNTVTPSHRPVAALGPALFVFLILSGCSRSPAPVGGDVPPPTAQQAATAPAPAPAKTAATACQMVTQAEMSAILGIDVVARDNTHSNGETNCLYSTPSGFPSVELEVDWGSGEGAMGAAAMMNRKEPGIADPYAGIGDQAVDVGPMLMIRTGEDLMQLVFSGVENIPAKAKKIFDTAKARM